MGGLVSRNRSGLRPASSADVFEPEKLSLHIFEHQAERFFLIFDRMNIQSIDGNFIVGIAEADSQPSCCPVSIEMIELSTGNPMDLQLYAPLARKAFSDCTYSGARHRVLVGHSPLESMSPPGSESAMMAISNTTPSRDGKVLSILERFVSNYRGTDFGASSTLTGSNMGLSPREAWHATDTNDELHLRLLSPHMISVLQGLLPTGTHTRMKLVLCFVGMARVMHDLDDLESMQRRSSVDTALLQRPRAYSMESHLPLSLSQSNVNPSVLHHIPREISISRSGSGQGPRLLAHHNSSHTIRASPPAFQHTEAVEDAGLRHSYDGRAMKRLSQKRMLAPTNSLPSLHGALGRGGRASTPAVPSGLVLPPSTGMSPPPVKQKTPIHSPRDFIGNVSDEEESPSPSPSSTPSGSVIGIGSPPFQFTPPGSNIAGRPPPGGSRTAPLFTPSPPLSDQAIELLNEQKMRRIIDAINRTLTERKQSAEQVRDVEWSGE